MVPMAIKDQRDLQDLQAQEDQMVKMADVVTKEKQADLDLQDLQASKSIQQL